MNPRQAKEELFQIIEEIRKRNPDVDSEDVLAELEAMDHPNLQVQAIDPSHPECDEVTDL